MLAVGDFVSFKNKYTSKTFTQFYVIAITRDWIDFNTRRDASGIRIYTRKDQIERIDYEEKRK